MGLMELQRGLFPVQYTESFYTKLFTPGYYCFVGVAPDGEIVAVVSARAIAFATEAGIRLGGTGPALAYPHAPGPRRGGVGGGGWGEGVI